MSWPASVGDASIDYNLPEYWRADNSEDSKLMLALATACCLVRWSRTEWVWVRQEHEPFSFAGRKL